MPYLFVIMLPLPTFSIIPNSGIKLNKKKRVFGKCRAAAHTFADCNSAPVISFPFFKNCGRSNRITYVRHAWSSTAVSYLMPQAAYFTFLIQKIETTDENFSRRRLMSQGVHLLWSNAQICLFVMSHFNPNKYCSCINPQTAATDTQRSTCIISAETL